MAKVMNLVDPRLLERLVPTAPVNPLHKTISTLDQDMDNILQRQDLVDADKVRLYNQVLQKYLEYQDHYRFPEQPTHQQTPPE